MATILIVDDSPIDRRLAAGLVGHSGSWTIQLAADGTEALTSLISSPPDLIVTDLQMPEMNGLELVSAIRRKYPQIPVVLMTAQGSEEIAVEALRAGAASYVPKRILSTELVPTIRRVLSQANEELSQSSLMNQLMSRREHYRLSTDLSLTMGLSRYIQHQLGDAWRLEKTDRLRFGMAIEEALLNAYYHGNLEISSQLKEDDYARFYSQAEERLTQSPYQDRKINVQMELTPATVTIVIRDEGPGFDWTKLPDPLDVENLDRPSGRGVMLMRSFLDTVTYNQVGNEVTLVKRRFPREQ